MASPCRIIADDADLASEGERLVHELERRWSRFRADSEISRLNDAGGSVCVTTEPTRQLLERAEFARVATGGRFNPFVLERLEAIEAAAIEDLPLIDLGVWSAPLDASLQWDRSSGAVQLPIGMRFDPGGIGKGFAGDLVVEHLRSLGSVSVQVELGGDVRVAGPNWVDVPWRVEIIDPRDRAARLGTLSIEAGAVATSSVLGRRWRVGNRELHHLIDPRTGWPCESDLVAVTATSSELWWAEVVAKAALIAGSAMAADLMAELGVSGVLLVADGSLIAVDGVGVMRSEQR